MTATLRLGTRGSQLAVAQSSTIQAALQAAHPGLKVELVIIQTKGDVILDRALSKIGDKGLFVTEIEHALQAGTIDLAVHSCKDLPSSIPDDLILAAFPRRADPRDAVISRHGVGLHGLPNAARIGTSSLRRACQLRALRPDCQVIDLRGNVDTRLRKAASEEYDAIILAAAGLARLGLSGAITELLDPTIMLPAVAQGALAIECRAADQATIAFLSVLDDPATRAAVSAERAFLARLEGGCQVPMAAHATLAGDLLVLHGLIGNPDGTQLLHATLDGPAMAAERVGVSVAENLLVSGGHTIIAQWSQASSKPEEAL